MKHLKSHGLSLGKHFLHPLSIVEMAALMGAMALAWGVAAVVIVVWHVLRMGAMALRGSRSSLHGSPH